MSDLGESSDLEKALKEQACTTANKMLEVVTDNVRQIFEICDEAKG